MSKLGSELKPVRTRKPRITQSGELARLREECARLTAESMHLSQFAKISISVIEAILEHAPANGANDASDFLRGQVAALRRVLLELGEQQ